jgi:hypothetical protein
VSRATIGGVVFEGGEGLEGFFIDLEDGLVGWDDSVDVRREAVEMANAHGDYDLPVHRGNRVIVITGDCVSSSPEQQQKFRNQLAGILADGRSGKLTVDHQGTIRWANVRLANDGVKFAIKVYGTLARYQITLLAADPRKYGDVNPFGPIGAGELSVFHRGNFWADPVCTVSGTFSADFAIYYNGLPFRMSHDVVPEAPITIHMRDGRAYQNGIRIIGGIVIANTFTIPPGLPTTITFDPNGGTGTLKVEVPDTDV